MLEHLDAQIVRGQAFRLAIPSGIRPGTPEARTFVAAIARRLGVNVTLPPAPGSTPQAPTSAQLDARGAAGRNGTERAMAALAQRDPGFARLPLEDQIERAASGIALGTIIV